LCTALSTYYCKLCTVSLIDDRSRVRVMLISDAATFSSSLSKLGDAADGKIAIDSGFQFSADRGQQSLGRCTTSVVLRLWISWHLPRRRC